ncbi:MAG: substrate-binding domain-containing protein [Azospirillaceae bacterium]
MRMNVPKFVCAAVLSAGLMAGAAMPASAADSDYDWSGIDITFIVWTAEDVEFFVPSINGARDAAAQQGINLDIQFGDGDTVTQNNIIETSIANEVDGIAVSIWDDEAFDEAVCAAMEAGIPVVAHNIDDSQGADGTCRLAYIGQDFVETGYAIGQRMIEEHGIGEGDLVFTPVEFPEAVYAVYRHEGVAMAMEEVGATTELLGTGSDHSEALNIMTQYLIGHPETVAIIGLGSSPTSVAVRAANEAGLDIPTGGFDVTPEIIDAIKDGTMTATVDQQPYSQGYYAVTQLALMAKYGHFPSDMNTGGSGLLDSTNVETAEEWAGITR